MEVRLHQNALFLFFKILNGSKGLTSRNAQKLKSDIKRESLVPWFAVDYKNSKAKGGQLYTLAMEKDTLYCSY